MKPKYPITLSLDEEEKDKVEALRKNGITLIQIFRVGLKQWDEEKN